MPLTPLNMFCYLKALKFLPQKKAEKLFKDEPTPAYFLFIFVFSS